MVLPAKSGEMKTPPEKPRVSRKYKNMDHKNINVLG